MLKIIGWVIRASVFAAMVLVIGNYLHIGNRTVSDQVKTQISHAERSEVVNDVKQKIDQGAELIKKSLATTSAPASNSVRKNRILPNMKSNVENEQSSGIKTAHEEIPSSERQKLQSLMRELNSARQSN